MGLSSVDDFWDQVRGEGKMLLLTSRSFDFAAELPDHVRYVSAVLDAAPGRLWALPTGQDPIVLVAMSSTFQNHGRGLQRIIEGLTTLPVRGIATIGPALDPTRFRATSNVSIASAAPHSAILRHAGVVVTHGGSDHPSLVWLRKPSHVSRLHKGECPYDVLRYQLVSALS
jgi:UDP:flavonoid glycosyltransferase YjiC (YdhE family)